MRFMLDKAGCRYLNGPHQEYPKKESYSGRNLWRNAEFLQRDKEAT